MHLDDLTIKEARELACMFGHKAGVSSHPLSGKKVLVVLPHGFIYFGRLKQCGEWFTLTEASNLRYWKGRDNGLPEFVAKGPIDGDRVDSCADYTFSTHIGMMEIVKW